MSAPLILAANTVVADDLRVENALNFMGATNTSSRFAKERPLPEALIHKS